MRIPAQLVVTAALISAGIMGLAVEVFLVKWYPVHEQQIRDDALKLLPYRNESLGIEEMQIAGGIYGKVQGFPGGVRIYRPHFLGMGPSITITQHPNLDQVSEFSPQTLANWQTDGVQKNIPRYNFDHTPINGRDAALIWQWKTGAMIVTAHVISPSEIVEVTCSTAGGEEKLYLEACEESLRSIKLAGPLPQPKPPEGVEEIPSLPGTIQ